MAEKGTEVYEKLPGPAQNMLAIGARKKLMDMEQEVYQKTGSKEQALQLRPSKGADYALHLANIVLSGAKEALQNYAEIRLSTDHNGNITDFSYQLKDTGETR